MTNLLNAAKAALEVMAKGMSANYWSDIHPAMDNLRAAIADAEKQEPVLYMDNRTDVVSPALRHTRKGYDTPLYLHPAAPKPENKS